jgi:D-alanine-D-alanine ligase
MKKILIAVAFNERPTNDTLDANRCKDSIAAALSSGGYIPETLRVSKKDFENGASEIIQRVNSSEVLCVFNLFEGFSDNPGKEIDFVRILEQNKIIFTGNSSDTLKKCLNKEQTKKILVEANVPTPKWVDASAIDLSSEVNLKYPLFIKPCCQDASVGIDETSLVYNKEELVESIDRKKSDFPKGLMVSEFIGGNEYNVGFLGDGGYEVLGISAIDYSKYKNLPHYLTYSAKWEEKSEEFKKIIPDPAYVLPPQKKDIIIETATKAARALGCKSYFRVDMRETEEQIYVIDINPNPDINADSGYIHQAQHRGYKYQEIIEKIVSLALLK